MAINVGDPDADPSTAALIWLHALAIGYSPAYLTENADGIRRDWPRIPLPADKGALEASAALGGDVAALLDTEADVAGVTAGKIRPLLKTIGVVSRAGGGSLDPGHDLAVTAGWGHKGKDGVTMPARGRLTERPYDDAEKKVMAAEAAALGLTADALVQVLGDTTFDVHLNDVAYWRNIPRNVWEFHIGGYQVIKKWLSYREASVLGRPLKADEAREAADTARRLTAIALLRPRLDENYRRAAAAAFDWKSA